MKKKNYKICWYWNQKTKISLTSTRSISTKNVDINKIIVSNKVSFAKNGLKYFIGYKDAKIRPLVIFIPKCSAYRRKD